MKSAPSLGAMRGHRRLGSLLLLLVLSVFAFGASTATAATLFGAVSTQIAGGAPAPATGALVTVLDPSTDATVALATTGIDGAYSAVVPDGTYDVRFDPPSGGDFASTTVSGIAVASSKRLDVVLVPAGLARLSGTVRDATGTAVAGALVYVGPSNGGNVGQATTGADGSYSLVAPPGQYRLFVSGPSNRLGLPETWRLSSTDLVDLNGDLSRDVNLPPVARVTVRLVGADDQPVVGARIDLPLYGVQPVDLGGWVGGVVSGSAAGDLFTGQTDTQGEFSFVVFDGSSSGSPGTVTPPAGSGYGVETFRSPVADGDTVATVQLDPTARLSGVLRDADGVPVAGALVYVGPSNGGNVGQATTGADGTYSLTAAPGQYRLFVSGPAGRQGLPETWRLSSTDLVDLNADTTRDVTLPPVARVTVRLVGADDEPVAGARIDLPLYGVQPVDLGGWIGGVVSGSAAGDQFTGFTDAEGEYSFVVFDGSSSGSPGTVTPPAGSDYSVETFRSPVADGDTVATVQLDPTARLSGVLRDADGVPVAGALVYVGPSNGGNVGQATTGADGTYSLTAAPGQYRLFVSGPAGRQGLPETWRLSSTDLVDLNGDITRDVDLPAVAMVTVRVLGADDQPVVGARIDLPLYGVQPVDLGGWIGGVASGSAAGDQFSGLTDENGEYRFRVFDGSSSGSPGTVTPPAGSGYRAETFRSPVADGDTTLVVRFTPLDTTAPTVRCDPPPTGWHTGDVSVACTASDAGSGLADPADGSFSLSTSVGDGHEDAAAQTGTHQVCDRAGNCSTAGPVGPIEVDRAAPAIAYTQANDGANGWWVHSPATIHVTATDLNIGSTLTCTVDGVARRLTIVSGPTTRGADIIVRGEGRHTVSCTAADTLGHSGTTTGAVLIDLKVPRAPSLAADRAPDYTGGSGSWYTDTVTVTATGNGDPALADGSAGSGVDPNSIPAPQAFTTSGSHVASATVADIAGHQSGTTRLTVKVDADPPTTTLVCPAADVAAGSRSNARWKDADGQSGLAGTATGTIALDTSTLGTHTAQHIASDHVGHTARSSCDYHVVFGYRPVGATRAPPTFNAVARVPSPTLVTFTLSGNQGLAVFAPGYPQVQPVSCADGTPSGAPAAAQAAAPLAYAAGTDRYTYSWDSSGVATGSCVALQFGFVDGTVHEAWYRR